MMPDERLLWGRGLSEADQVRMAEISLWIPDEQWRRLLKVQDDEARHQEFDAICLGYQGRWEMMNDQRAHNYDSPLYGGPRIDRFHAHLADHWGCPGIHKCGDFEPREGAGDGPGCPFCGGELVKARDKEYGSHYRCWKASK